LPKINQHFPLQDPPKFTQIDIFGLKIFHLATLIDKFFNFQLVGSSISGSGPMLRNALTVDYKAVDP
jgi:hypothetical protein